MRPDAAERTTHERAHERAYHPRAHHHALMRNYEPGDRSGGVHAAEPPFDTTTSRCQEGGMVRHWRRASGGRGLEDAAAGIWPIPSSSVQSRVIAPSSVCLLRIFGRIQKSLRSRWGLGPCNQSIASGFGAAEIKSGFWRVSTFFGRPAAPFRALARVEAALARRSDHPGFARRLWFVRAVKTIIGSRWRVP